MYNISWKETRRALKISEESMVNSFTDDEMARRIVEHSRPKRTLKIYDGQFKLLEEMKPACKTEKAAKRLKESDVVIELQRSENHYRPLFRWDSSSFTSYWFSSSSILSASMLRARDADELNGVL